MSERDHYSYAPTSTPISSFVCGTLKQLIDVLVLYQKKANHLDHDYRVVLLPYDTAAGPVYSVSIRKAGTP